MCTYERGVRKAEGLGQLACSSGSSGSSRHTSMSLLFVIDRQFAVEPNRCTDPSGHRAFSTEATCAHSAWCELAIVRLQVTSDGATLDSSMEHQPSGSDQHSAMN